GVIATVPSFAKVTAFVTVVATPTSPKETSVVANPGRAAKACTPAPVPPAADPGARKTTCRPPLPATGDLKLPLAFGEAVLTTVFEGTLTVWMEPVDVATASVPPSAETDTSAAPVRSAITAPPLTETPPPV